MIEREVWVGEGSAEGDRRVWKVFERIVTVGLRGFRGVTGSEWRRYQVKTEMGQLRWLRNRRYVVAGAFDCSYLCDQIL